MTAGELAGWACAECGAIVVVNSAGEYIHESTAEAYDCRDARGDKPFRVERRRV